MKSILISLLIVMISFSQSEKLDEFIEIELNVHADVRVVISNENKIEFGGSQREIDKIDYEVYGDKLRIEHSDLRRGFFGWFRDFDRDLPKVRITIHTKILDELEFDGRGTLEIEGLKGNQFYLGIKGPIDATIDGSARDIEVKNYGPGDIEFDEIDSEYLEVGIYGPGDVHIRGNADKVKAAIYGPGNLGDYRLDAKTLNAKIYGPGDIKMTVTQRVDATIIGPGDVRIKGDPDEVNESSIGPGDVVIY